MALDSPFPGVAVQPFQFAGWAIDRRATSGPGIDAVHLWAYPASGSPIFLGAPAFGNARPDVGAAFGSQFTNSGFAQVIRGLQPGNYTLTASAHSSVTGTFVDVRAVSVTIRNNPLMVNDAPANGAPMLPTHFTISGWALDTGGLERDRGRCNSRLCLSGLRRAACLSRCCSVWRRATGCGRGLRRSIRDQRISPRGVQPRSRCVPARGVRSQQGERRLRQRGGRERHGDRGRPDVHRCAGNGDGGAALRRYRGWAIDRGASSGPGVNAVHVWAYPLSGAPAVFVGAATTGQSRPDVGNFFGAQFTNSGYSLTVSSLAPGAYDLVVFARSTVTGTFNNARVVRVTVPVTEFRSVTMYLPPGCMGLRLSQIWSRLLYRSGERRSLRQDRGRPVSGRAPLRLAGRVRSPLALRGNP